MEKFLQSEFHNFFDHDSELVCCTRNFQDFQFISAKWQDVLGFQTTQLNRNEFFQLLHPDDVTKTREILELAASGTKIFNFQNRFVAHSKEIRWLEWRIFTIPRDESVYIAVAREITHFKNSEHFLKLSQEQAKLGTWRFNFHTSQFDCSDEIFNIYETQDRSSFNYARNASYYDEKNWARLNKAFASCLEEAQNWDLEIEIITETGALKWVRSWGFPIRLGKEIIGVEGLLMDLTRKKSEEFILKQAVEELDKIQQSINQHCLVTRLNPFGFFMDCNQFFEKITGYRNSELIGKHFNQLSSSLHYSELFNAFHTKLLKGQECRGEFKQLKKDGSYFWVDMSLTPIIEQASNNLSEIICISYDITEKKLNDERYQNVLSGINAGIWDWTDISNRDIYWSPKMFEILEYQENELELTTDLMDVIIHPDDQEAIKKAVRELIKYNTSFLLEHRVLCGNKKYKWIQSMAIALRDDNGRTYRIIGSTIDINQKKLIEFNLEEEKQKTVQSSKLATLGEMAAGLAHEVNNPLTIIFGYIRILEEELLSQRLDPDRLHKFLGLINNAAQRAANIVTNLKDFARDGSGDPFVNTPVSQLVNMVLDLCAERFKKNGIRIDLELSSDPQIYCRKIELSQVLLNLLFNSFDAIQEQDQRWVKISVKEERNLVELSITDSGPGLAAHVAERIFTPFFTTKKVGLGTGIGLSISQRIVLNHGGEILYDGNSTNTKFVVRLPYSYEIT